MTSRRPVVIGTRGSPLARLQAEEVATALRRQHPDREVRLHVVQSRGDREREASLVDLGLGVFTGELEAALLAGDVDVAVHSLKDLPTETPSDLTIAAVPPRQDPRDVLVSRDGSALDGLAPHARVGTSSPRRVALVLAQRSDVEMLPIRGNVETRLRKAMDGQYEAVVLAAAGLRRLGLEGHAAEVFDPTVFVPAPGQGALAVEVRADDPEMAELVGPLSHHPTAAAVTAERAFLRSLGGGCRVPVGAYGRVEGETLLLTGLVVSDDGSRVYRTTLDGRASDPDDLGRRLAREVLAMGASALVAGEA